MLKAIIFSLFCVIPVTFAQDSNTASCPCPYSLDANGNRCGANSAWSKSGGAGPQCYSNESVTQSSCPPIGNYSVPAGFRVAGISPSCQAVIIPLS